MRSVEEVRRLAMARFRNHHRRWAMLPDLGAEDGWEVPLHPPTERQAAGDPDAVARWIGSWGRAEGRYRIAVSRVRHRWPRFGVQQLPSRVRIPDAETTARLAGRVDGWRRLTSSVRRVRAVWPHAPYLQDGLGQIAPALLRGEPDLLDRLIPITEWLLAHPDSDLLPRQLPVPGVDTKWFERHHGIVSSLVAAVSGRSGVGLASEAQRFRVRLLDPALAPELPRDFTTTVAELDALPLHPARVLIIENLASLASVAPAPGVIAVHGRGYAITQLAKVGWLTRSPASYWGDLDSHGFAILARGRAALPQLRSVLMDRETLRRFAPLAVREPRPYRAELAGLTAEEVATLDLLRPDDLRLEQERIDTGYAESRLIR